MHQLLREYRDMFALFDTSKDGTVSLCEFADAMDLFGIVDIDLATIKRVLAKHDDSDTEIEIDFVEFLFLMTSDDEGLNVRNLIELICILSPVVATVLVKGAVQVIKANLTGFREAFKLFDDDDSGTVCRLPVCWTSKLIRWAQCR